jgi:CheY-like chemotaxis protein
MGAGSGVTPQILVVDDDENVRQAIRWMLEDEGYLVSEAADGSEALRLMREKPPDLVVLDLTMPEVDGYAVAAALQTREGPRIPILLITADGQAPAKAERINAFAYLRKPFAVKDFLSTIRTQLRPG